MLDSKHLGRAAVTASALGLALAAAPAAAETTTYTGSGNYVSEQELMPLASGDAVVLGNAQGTMAISTEPPSLLDVRCSAMGLSKPSGDYGSVFYCAFTDPVMREDGFDVKGIESKDAAELEVVGGSGRWAGASGAGRMERMQEWANGGSVRFEVTITTP